MVQKYLLLVKKYFLNQKFIVVLLVKIRAKLTKKCSENGIKIMSVVSNNSIIMDNVEIGNGSIISPFVTITSDVKIGQSFHANIYSYVAHDCVIGDFVTFAPGVKCNGNVHIGSGAYMELGQLFILGQVISHYNW